MVADGAVARSARATLYTRHSGYSKHRGTAVLRYRHVTVMSPAFRTAELPDSAVHGFST